MRLGVLKVLKSFTPNGDVVPDFIFSANVFPSFALGLSGSGVRPVLRSARFP